MKKKASTLKDQRLNCHAEEIEVYKSSRHEEGKSLFKTSIRTNIFLCIPPLQIMPTMRKKKKKSIFKLFTCKIRRQRILTCE
jgi:hypothetical protein